MAGGEGRAGVGGLWWFTTTIAARLWLVVAEESVQAQLWWVLDVVPHCEGLPM